VPTGSRARIVAAFVAALLAAGLAQAQPALAGTASQRNGATHQPPQSTGTPGSAREPAYPGVPVGYLPDCVRDPATAVVIGDTVSSLPKSLGCG
jgi:hypothetical protein